MPLTCLALRINEPFSSLSYFYIHGARPGAGAWSLTSESLMTGLGRPATCSRTGACCTLKIWMRRCVAAQRKIAAYHQQYADNQNISFLPAIVSTSTRMHGEFLCLLFLQAHRETEAHFTVIGMSSLNVQGCSIVAPPMHAPSHAPLLLPLLLSHNLPTPRVR